MFTSPAAYSSTLLLKSAYRFGEKLLLVTETLKNNILQLKNILKLYYNSINR